MTNIFQAPILVNFLYPMLLVFFIVFAILEKTKILGAEDKKQLNALVALVVSLIFVAAVFPKIIVGNMIQFMAVGLVIIFVGLMLWGFVSGEGKLPAKTIKSLGILVFVAVIFAVIWATELGGPLVLIFEKIFTFLFNSSWSGTFWTNALIVGIVAVVVAVIFKGSSKVGLKK